MPGTRSFRADKNACPTSDKRNHHGHKLHLSVNTLTKCPINRNHPESHRGRASFLAGGQARAIPALHRADADPLNRCERWERHRSRVGGNWPAQAMMTTLPVILIRRRTRWRRRHACGPCRRGFRDDVWAWHRQALHLWLRRALSSPALPQELQRPALSSFLRVRGHRDDGLSWRALRRHRRVLRIRPERQPPERVRILLREARLVRRG